MTTRIVKGEKVVGALVRAGQAPPGATFITPLTGKTGVILCATHENVTVDFGDARKNIHPSVLLVVQ